VTERLVELVAVEPIPEFFRRAVHYAMISFADEKARSNVLGCISDSIVT